MMLQRLSVILKAGRRCMRSTAGALSTSAHGIDRLGIQPPFTYQKDVTLANIHEIMELLTRDPTYGNNMYNSPTIVRAVTAESDRPWWTCRDANGTMVGFFLVSRARERPYVVANTMYIDKEARGHNLGGPLYSKIFEAMNEEPKAYFRAWYSEAGASVGHKTHKLYRNEEKALTIRYGVPKYDPTMLRESGEVKFSIIPFSKEHLLFDKFVAWDTSRVHDVQRTAFWNVLLDNSSPVHSYVAVEKSTQEIIGFGAIQPAFDEGCMIIGPLYAEDDEIALGIMRHLMEHYGPEQRVIATHYEQNNLMDDFFNSMEVPTMMVCSLLSSEHDTFPLHLTKQMFLSPSNSLCMQ